MMRNRRQIARLAILAAAAALAVTPSAAYYHYVHFQGRTAPFNPIYEKFDLSRLPNNTVTFYVSDQGPAVYGTNDSFGSVLSQLKQAVAAWNSVSSSDLRLVFGGLESYSANPSPTAPGGPLTSSNTPGGDVVFVDLPGLVGMGGPTTSATPVTGPNGTFYPVVRGLVMMSRDTTVATGPSYFENFYTTAVHEVGHAIGLQHTWTAGAMSQGIIRNTSRTRPIEPDDAAALSILYGKQNWQANFGSISGQVSFTNGQPVSLASVVAISAAGPAISTLTNPDGTYRIEGIPQGRYFIYAHPLPPGTVTANGEGIRLPVDQNRNSFTASGLFQTVFYPGTIDYQQATMVSVETGANGGGVDFRVQARSSVPVYDVVTYSNFDPVNRRFVYNGSVSLTPAYIHTAQSPSLVIVQPPVDMAVPVSATLLGGFPNAQQPIRTFPFKQGRPLALALYFDVPVGVGTGPRHMILNFGNDLYVLPGAVTLVSKAPPAIQSAAQNPDGTVTLAGAGFGSDSHVFFDGAEAVIVGTGGDEVSGAITVTPPPADSGQTVTLSVYNADSQNSMLLQSANPKTYTYAVTAPAQLGAISVRELPASSSAAVEIEGINTNFVSGYVSVGFGSNDVAVRRVWVLSPTRLIANVSVASGASLALSEVSVISGLQAVWQANAFQSLAARAGFPFLGLPVVNADASQATIYPGSIASLYGSNLAAGTIQVTLNDQPVAIQFAGPNQINFVVPATMPAGPATLRFNNGQIAAFPVIVQIDNPPPAVVGVTNVSGASLAGITLGISDVLNVLVTGLDPAAILNVSRIHVMVGGFEVPLQSIAPMPNGVVQLQVVLTRSFNGAQVPVTVVVDGSSGAPVQIAIR
jgi:uncharacterized protein (TIGR03437 family)